MVTLENKITKWIFSCKIVKYILYRVIIIFCPAKKMKLKDYIIRTIEIYNGKQASESLFSKIIWSYWEGDESLCGSVCQKSWRENTKGFNLNLVTPENIKYYLPDFPDTPEDVPVQLKSDLVRLMLLERFGGVWMDYSIFLTSDISDLLSIMKERLGDVMLFYNEFPGEYKKDPLRPVVENGFIAAKKNQDFIIKWRKQHQDVIMSGNWKGFYRDSPEYGDLVKNFMSKDEDLIDYLVCYISAQKVMLDGHSSNLLLLNSEDDYYSLRYQIEPPLRSFKIANSLLLRKKKSIDNLPVLIKLTKGNRRLVDEYLKYSCVKKQSLFGQYLEI
ncbi:capsular polysaccharide synthesis protein [Thiopseudomonas acetoxidans]|uniref:Capsular polysaccharide synthesis protein n=1 Tax=Thiopseudomonas acetoxidans TaxID=3041622 RepID=A0ABT7SRQ9_9GAMM|nr:capsular polysaccharide synthesis protein [Thiopseudomonas sp. CY1220]MDM7858830.1 capsular polysaccharide synthesis protein [Thiopseudomonas sp. CY1220]